MKGTRSDEAAAGIFLFGALGLALVAPVAAQDPAVSTVTTVSRENEPDVSLWASDLPKDIMDGAWQEVRERGEWKVVPRFMVQAAKWNSGGHGTPESIHFYDKSGAKVRELRLEQTYDASGKLWEKSQRYHTSPDRNALAIVSSKVLSRKPYKADVKSEALGDAANVLWTTDESLMSMSPDGSYGLRRAPNGAAVLLGRAGQATWIRLANDSNAYTSGLAFSPSGNLWSVAAQIGGLELFVYDRFGNKVWGKTFDPAPQGNVTAAAFSPRETYLAVAGGEVGKEHVAVYNRGGTELWRKPIQSGSYALKFSADEKLLFGMFYEGHYLFDAGTGQVLWFLPESAIEEAVERGYLHPEIDIAPDNSLFLVTVMILANEVPGQNPKDGGRTHLDGHRIYVISRDGQITFLHREPLGVLVNDPVEHEPFASFGDNGRWAAWLTRKGIRGKKIQ